MHSPCRQFRRILSLLLFLTYSLCHRSNVRHSELSRVFLFSRSIHWSSSHLHFKNGPEYLATGKAQVFILLIKFQLYSLILSSFLALLGYSFLIFSSSPLVWYCNIVAIFSNIFEFPFFRAFWFFLGSIVLFFPSFASFCFLYLLIFTTCEIFSPALAGDLLLESDWQQVSSGIRDFSQDLLLLCLSLRIFHTSVSWWSFKGVWVTVSLLKSPKLFSVFWPILIML